MAVSKPGMVRSGGRKGGARGGVSAGGGASGRAARVRWGAGGGLAPAWLRRAEEAGRRGRWLGQGHAGRGEEEGWSQGVGTGSGRKVEVRGEKDRSVARSGRPASSSHMPRVTGPTLIAIHHTSHFVICSPLRPQLVSLRSRFPLPAAISTRLPLTKSTPARARERSPVPNTDGLLVLS